MKRLSPGLRSFVELGLTVLGFAAAFAVYDRLFLTGLTPGESLLLGGASVGAFWLAIQLKGRAAASGSTAAFMEQFSFGAGVNLLLHAVMTYAFHVRRTPFLVLSGSLLSAILIAVWGNWLARRERADTRVLLVGFDGVSERIAPAIVPPPIGVVADDPALLPPGLPLLGATADLEALVALHRPTRLVVSVDAWDRTVSPAFLLQCRMNGVEVEDAAAAYERALSKVCCERLQPVDLLLSSVLKGDSRVIAIQSVYTNLIALTFLILLLPVILAASAAVAMFSGPGRIVDSVECAGFQYIPFRLLRFRTTRLGGEPTRVGMLLRQLRLANLPQLINVVRGDMALVGPRPVRREFAEYLTGLMPFYSHRFSVRPGIIGWASLNTSRAKLPDETERIEYDLYYIKEGSLWMDAEILTEMALGRAGRTS